MNTTETSSEVINLSPIPVISALSYENRTTFVVRDDLLPGGTKQRAAGEFVNQMLGRGYENFVYASPFSGFAQVALASVCRILGVKCTIVCERDKRFTHPDFHPFSKEAQAFGAKLIMVNNLTEAEELASMIARKPSTLKIPLGFDSPEFKQHLEREIRNCWQSIEAEIGMVETLWLPVGSGTLARTFLKSIPSRTKIKCVNVRVLEATDPRIKEIKEHSQMDYYEAPMLFHQEATDFPKIPSNVFYDAKLWNFIKRYGSDGDLWWNVAR